MADLTQEQKRMYEEAQKAKQKEKVLSMLGFSAKAGKLVSGTDKVCDEIRRHGIPNEDGEGKAIRGMGTVLIASDASDNTKKRVINCCRYYGIRYVETDITSDKIAEKTGKLSLSAVCATFDRGFSNAIVNALENARKKI